MLLSIIIVLIIRNHPEEIGAHAYGLDEEEVESFEEFYVKAELPKRVWILFGTTCFIMGCIGGPGLVFLSMLFSSSDMSAGEIAVYISIIGALMTVSKVVIGRIIDKIGTYRTLTIYSVILAAGLLMTPLLVDDGLMRYMSVLFIGVGF